MTREYTRHEIIRMGGFASAGAFIGSMSIPDPAWAMHPKFDMTLKLVNGIVSASGPTNFASDEEQALVVAIVAQDERVQVGESAWTPVTAKSWSARLSGPPLKPGHARAYGVAYVELDDGLYDWYPWGMAVTLA